MASSDDEDEKFPTEVSDYHFEDGNNEPVSFAQLALKLDDDKSLDSKAKEIGLRGKIDNGLQQYFAQVNAWKYDISPAAKPEVLVLTKKGNWIKLLKPKKSYREIVRSILITVHCLHYVKGHPETSGKALWENLAKVFRLFDPQPSVNDLVDHLDLVSEAVERIEELKGSKALTTVLENKQIVKKVPPKESGNATMSSFIVDEVHDDDDENEIDEDEFEEEGEDAFESVCAICDNGGKIFCCEGKCLRSFHFTEEAGEDSNCDSLGYSQEEAEIFEKENQTFVCKNCELNIHLCFICGKLGSSDKSAGAEVFQCVAGTCGYFYHPNCAAKALRFKFGDKATDMGGEIAAGKPFMCPIHYCAVCRGLEPEDTSDEHMQFAVCRRCPKAYHRKCLPRSISFEDEDKGIEQRAWTGLLVNKILIYCTKHEMDYDLGTPARNHVKFPGTTDPVKGKQGSDMVSKEKAVPKKREIVLKDASRAKTASMQSKAFGKSSSALKKSNSFKRNESQSSTTEVPKKRKLADNSRLAVMKTLPRKNSKLIDDEGKSSLGDQPYAAFSRKDSDSLKTTREEAADTQEPESNGSIIVQDFNDPVMLNEPSKKRILSILREAESSITLEDINAKHENPSTHVALSKNMMQYFQDMTMGKVEVSVEAIRAAAQILDEGGNLEDAKAVCNPGLLKQITNYKNKLKVYLAPFLHGSRYTSFGRHFTQVEKLQEIVDKLCWYVEDGDMVVDFCCGANDFSCLMKKKMDEMGKNCDFKNYDIYPAPNDFNFEQKDWMKVNTGDLPEGKRLIMGLNPPFGAGASLANKFIDKALQFKPKLLILIVPCETAKVDDKSPYDLIWEDDKLLSGKAFYLPGSIDANDKQLEDWNKNPPPLSLWSHRDWTFKHMEIAQRQGHLPGAQKMEESHPQSELTHNHEEPRELNRGSDQPDAKKLEVNVEKESQCHDENPSVETVHTRSPRDDGKRDQAKGRGGEESSSKRKRGGGGGRKPQESAKRGKKGAGAQREGYPRREHANVPAPQQHLDTGYGSYPDDRMGPMGRGNSMEREDHYFHHPGNRWLAHPMDHPGSDFRMRSPHEPLDYPMNPAYAREAELRQHHHHMHGHQNPGFAGHPGNHPPGPPPPPRFPPAYALGGPMDSGYDSNSSAMHRYAPRLDELNSFTGPMQHPDGSMGMRYPHPDGSMGMPYPPHPDGSMGMPYPPHPGPPPGRGRGGYHPLDFAHGPYPPFSPKSSSGWLNE